MKELKISFNTTDTENLKIYIYQDLAATEAVGLSEYHRIYLQHKTNNLNEPTSFHLNMPEGDAFATYIPSLNEADASDLESIRLSSVLISEYCIENKITNVSVISDTVLSEKIIKVFTEALCIGSYTFSRYKKELKEYTGIISLTINSANADEKSFKEIENLINISHKTKDIVNTPIFDFDVKALGEYLKSESDKLGISFTSLSKSEMEELGMGGLLGVNKGSVDDPGFFVLEYKSAEAKNEKPIVFVGKGVVYDTGGYSIKQSSTMPTMKADMGGAAAVSGGIFAIAANKLPLHIISIIPATDNKINSNALVPDDVITISNGKTVEVLNTDAEGRLILADALVYAKNFDPELVISFATLTGAAAYLTGTFSSAWMTKADSTVNDAFEKAGLETYERLLKLPLWKEYGDMMKSDIADIKNVGGRVGGMITAGKFLEFFTDYTWMHVDIAGPAFIDNKEAYKSKGATAVGVRLLHEFAKSI